MQTLYKVITEENIYGHQIATDSAGNIVLEIQGGGVKAYKKSELEEVLPYTVSIVFVHSGSSNVAGGTSKEYSYTSFDGEFSKGDLLFGGLYNNFAVVTKVNTKSKSATKRFNGWKISSERINEEE